MHQGNYKFFVRIWCYIIISTALLLHHHRVCADDAAFMQKLAKGLNMAGWSGNNPCQWSGVQCDTSGRVKTINLNGRNVSGQLPSDLNQLSSLQSLNLHGNQLSGPLPSLSNLSSLKEAYFDSNYFTSIPTDFLSGLTGLQTFSISKNPSLPQWTIPIALTDSTQLASFIAANANIIGPIPDIFGSFPSLQNLSLSYNNITGTLPPSFATSGIQNLWLNNQHISGRIDVIASMSQLTEAWLHVNNFSGPIPDRWVCEKLYDLQLRDNHFTGVIPADLTRLPELKNVTFQNNELQGSVPRFRDVVNVILGNTNGFCNNAQGGSCDTQVAILLQVASYLGYPDALAQSWRGNDACGNWDFITCNSGNNVTVINLANQNFSGAISPDIANLTFLRTLSLNGNNLTGPIPSRLTTLQHLQLLDVSNNNISGKVPSFAPGVTVRTAGNPFIGIDLPNGSSAGGTPSTPSGERKHLPPWIVALIGIIAATVVVVLGFVAYRIYVKKTSNEYKWTKGGEKRKILHKIDAHVNTRISTSQSSQSSDGVAGGIPIEVLREVTDNFSEENILGHGGFGIVYKGQLHDGKQIAVKRMEYAVISTKGLNEFKAEIEVLSMVKHRSLVSLIGFCVNGNERLLVYEYMPQGTLGQHLFSCQKRGITPLSWKQRVSIALDVARGVEYLHSLTQQSFIHRDLKPSNILLGDDMRAKVSDFGLVKSAPQGTHSIETRLAGTFGYLAPEYASTGKVTTKVDVFAFGVILMELISGQKALDDAQPEDKSHLVTWFRKVIVNKEEEIRNYLDPSLDPDDETFQSICKVAELAAHCTARDPYQRPTMGYSVNVLSPLVEQWKPAYNDEEQSFGIDVSMSLPQALQRWKSSEGDFTASGLISEDTFGFSGTQGMPSQFKNHMVNQEQTRNRWS